MIVASGVAFTTVAAACEAGTDQNIPTNTSSSDGVLALAAACDPESCSIELQRVVEISDSADPGLLGSTTLFSLYRDGSGRFVVPAVSGDMFVVFDSTGTLLATVGRRGSGPAEFQRVGNTVGGPGDTLYVYDMRLGRISAFSSDLDYSRTITLPFQPEYVLEDGSFVVSQQIPTRDQIGYPVHIFSQDGALRRSFGAEPPEYRRDLRLFMTRVVAPASDGNIWTAPPGRYRIEKWAPDGTRIDSVAAQPSWFQDTPIHTDPHERPGTVIEGLWEDEGGLLWVLTRVADLDWPPKNRVPENVEVPWTMEASNDRNDWILEAIDPSSGRLLAQRRFRDGLYHFSPTPLLVSDGPPGDNVTFLVWKPILQQVR